MADLAQTDWSAKSLGIQMKTFAWFHRTDQYKCTCMIRTQVCVKVNLRDGVICTHWHLWSHCFVLTIMHFTRLNCSIINHLWGAFYISFYRPSLWKWGILSLVAKIQPPPPPRLGGGDFVWEGFFEGGCFNGGSPLEVEKLKRWQCSGWKSAVVIVSLRSSMFSGLGGRTPNRGRLGKFGGKKKKRGRERCRIQPWKTYWLRFQWLLILYHLFGFRTPYNLGHNDSGVGYVCQWLCSGSDRKCNLVQCYLNVNVNFSPKFITPWEKNIKVPWKFAQMWSPLSNNYTNCTKFPVIYRWYIVTLKNITPYCDDWNFALTVKNTISKLCSCNWCIFNFFGKTILTFVRLNVRRHLYILFGSQKKREPKKTKTSRNGG